ASGRRARVVRGAPRDGTALHDQSVHGGRARRLVRDPPTRRRAGTPLAGARSGLARETSGGMKIQEAEYRQRTSLLAAHARQQGLEGVVLFDPAYVLYYVG